MTKKIYILAFGIFLLDLSLLYFNRNGNITLNPVILTQLSVSLIFGFFHGLKKYQLIKAIDIHHNGLDLVAQFFIYTAWYNVILLPLSGIALFEWILVGFVIFSDFVCCINSKKSFILNYIGNSDLNLLIFGSILAIFKSIVFYLFPSFIYLDSFVGNSTARFLILAFSVLGFCILVSFLVKNIKAKLGINLRGNSGQKDEQQKKYDFKAELKRMLTSFVALLSGPTVVIVVLSLGFLFLTIVFIFIKGLSNDILAFVEPYLIKLTSTGKSSVTTSVIYYICQIFVTASVLVYDRLSKEQLEKMVIQRLEFQIQENIKALKLTPTNKTELLEKTRKTLLEDNNFAVLSKIGNDDITKTVEYLR